MYDTLEETPCTVVDTVELLEELTEQLQQVTEFAVDLEVQRVYSGPYSCSCCFCFLFFYLAMVLTLVCASPCLRVPASALPLLVWVLLLYTCICSALLCFACARVPALLESVFVLMFCSCLCSFTYSRLCSSKKLGTLTK